MYNSTLLKDLAEELDEKVSSKIVSEDTYTVTSIKDALDSLEEYLKDDEQDNVWRDMTIFMSSFKFRTHRIVDELLNRLIQYMSFYNRMLEDDGVARKLVTHRDYSSTGQSSGEYKNYESETPQVQLTNFDDAIKYASNLEKNEDLRNTQKWGGSDFELKSFNWDEALRNMKMVFYNDLVNYVLSVPVLVYNYYALDQYPVQESVIEYINYMKNLRDMPDRIEIHLILGLLILVLLYRFLKEII